jgi:Baseplate J-like protein
VVDSSPVLPQKTSCLPAYVVCYFYLLLIVSTLVFQVYCMANPPIVTVTILPKSQQVVLEGTLQLGRLLSPITISQSQTVPATGTGHQDAQQAIGYIAFYNGQFQRVTIAAGTILTAATGIQVVTDQDAAIPAGNPPSYGQTTVSAHAISPGVRGNLPAYDINQACCATSVLAKNTHPFTGGQDARTYTTVTQYDIHSISTVLKTSLAASMQGALHGQLKPTEQLQSLSCPPIVTSDHQVGAEATHVKVTVSATCSAIAYTSTLLEEKVTALLSTRAQQKPGAGYSLFGTVHVSVKDATITHTPTPLVFLSFQAQGTWVYALSRRVQEQIKRSIAGKTKQAALQLLSSLPGIEQAAIQWEGFGDDTRVPKNSSSIHISNFTLLSNSGKASKGVGLCLPQKMYPNRVLCCNKTAPTPNLVARPYDRMTLNRYVRRLFACF